MIIFNFIVPSRNRKIFCFVFRQIRTCPVLIALLEGPSLAQECWVILILSELSS